MGQPTLADAGDSSGIYGSPDVGLKWRISSKITSYKRTYFTLSGGRDITDLV